MIRVLVVDDQPAFRRQLGRLLTRAGLRVVGEASTMREAKVQIRLLEPHLAVVDLMLPNVDCMEGIVRLKTLRLDLRVILVSVIHTHVDLIRTAAREAGAEDYVPKDELDMECLRAWHVREGDA